MTELLRHHSVDVGNRLRQTVQSAFHRLNGADEALRIAGFKLQRHNGDAPAQRKPDFLSGGRCDNGTAR